MTDFVLQISDWYRRNARILPWRNTKNAYFIWLSEVILQQTRVEQGRSYYEKFIFSYPTIEKLASAPEEDVLKLWQGLGYYSRARNLHFTAKQVVERHGGIFPSTHAEISALKGIGPYTAAAISSFAFDLPHAVVDGNVYRILSRYFGIDEPIDSTSGKKTFQALADSLIPHSDPATYNQAIMEFGAMACTPKNPNCEACPLLDSCASGLSKLYTVRPVKSKKTAVRNRYFHYFHIEGSETIALQKRTEKDVWQELYEFPMIETTSEELGKLHLETLGIQVPIIAYETKHILSHQHIYARFYKVSAAKTYLDQLSFVPIRSFDQYPIHRLMEKYWESTND